MPVVSDFFDAVVEGMTVTVECHASQFSGLGDLISFRWFRVDRRSHHDVVIDGARVINSIHGHGGGNFTGKLTFAPANKNDSGFYKCKAFNVHGSSPLSTAVFVDVKPALTNSDDCTCNCDSVMIIIAAVVLIIILLTIIAVLIAVIIYMRSRTGRLLIARNGGIAKKAVGPTELMDAAGDDPVCISITGTADCSTRTTPCPCAEERDENNAEVERDENSTEVEGDNSTSTLAHSEPEGDNTLSTLAHEDEKQA
jgi:hypothetical protein